jgi:PAS domain S-box-containing protein
VIRARFQRAADPYAVAVAWGVLAYLLTSVRIELPGPAAFHTDLTELALLGCAVFVRSPGLTLIACALEACNVVPPANLKISFETTFVMHAVAVPCAWYAHRALQRRELGHLALGLSWAGAVIVYYFAILMPLLIGTAVLFIPPELEPPIAPDGFWPAYWRIAMSIPYEVLLTAGMTAATVVTTEELRRRRRVGGELRAALESQRTLVRAAPIAVMTVRADGVVVTWNPAAERLFGVPAERALGAFAPHLCPLGGDAAESLVARLLGGAPLLGVEGEALVDGAIVPVSIFGAPLSDAAGGAILLIDDLRERLALRAQVQRSATMSALGQLVGDLAHELRNPLFGISAALDAGGPHLAGHPRLELMERTLRGEVNQLTALVFDLLEYGKTSAPGVRAPASLELPLRHAISACAAQAGAAGATLELALSPGLPFVPMDAASLVQAFRNLLQNAVAWSPPGAAVRIEANSERGWLRVEVLDRGSGFRVEDLPRVFEPFFSRRSGGTGLGLSIVRRIIEHHGGTIEASNRAGGGARVIVRLPAAVMTP